MVAYNGGARGTSGFLDVGSESDSGTKKFDVQEKQPCRPFEHFDQAKKYCLSFHEKKERLDMHHDLRISRIAFEFVRFRRSIAGTLAISLPAGIIIALLLPFSAHAA